MQHAGVGEPEAVVAAAAVAGRAAVDGAGDRLRDPPRVRAARGWAWGRGREGVEVAAGEAGVGLAVAAGHACCCTGWSVGPPPPLPLPPVGAAAAAAAAGAGAAVAEQALCGLAAAAAVAEAAAEDGASWRGGAGGGVPCGVRVMASRVRGAAAGVGWVPVGLTGEPVVARGGRVERLGQLRRPFSSPPCPHPQLGALALKQPLPLPLSLG